MDKAQIAARISFVSAVKEATKWAKAAETSEDPAIAWAASETASAMAKAAAELARALDQVEEAKRLYERERICSPGAKRRY